MVDPHDEMNPPPSDTEWLRYARSGSVPSHSLAALDRPTIAKAVVAGVTALAGTLMTALADAGITATEWVTIISSTLLAVAAVWATSNKP